MLHHTFRPLLPRGLAAAPEPSWLLGHPEWWPSRTSHAPWRNPDLTVLQKYAQVVYRILIAVYRVSPQQRKRFLVGFEIAYNDVLSRSAMFLCCLP
jgi:hypothetical protein